MGGPLRPQTDAGTIVEPQAVPFGLLVGNLEPLAPADRLDALVVDLPARPPRSLRFAYSRSGKSTRSRVTITRTDWPSQMVRVVWMLKLRRTTCFPA